VKTVLNCKELIFTELSTGIAANLGPGTVGIVAYPVNEE
jgi:fatty acid-binding protein DegV